MAGPLAFTPANKFYHAREVQILAEQDTRQAVETAGKDIAKAIDDTALDVANALSAATGYLTKSLAGIEQSLNDLADCICGIREGVNYLGRKDADNVTALYAAAVDTSGDIVD